MLPELLKTEEDLKVFRQVLELPLPICFRLNPVVGNRHLIQEAIDAFASSYATAGTDSPQDKIENDPYPLPLEPITKIGWVI